MPHEKPRHDSVSSVHEELFNDVLPTVSLDDIDGFNFEDEDIAGGFDEVEQHGSSVYGDAESRRGKELMADCPDAGLVPRHERNRELYKKYKDAYKTQNNNVAKKPDKEEWREKVAEQNKHAEDNTHRPFIGDDIQMLEKHVKQLLQMCGHTSWREPLAAMLCDCTSAEDYVQMIDFMIAMFEDSIHHKTRSPHKDHPISITTLPPESFAYNNFKTFVCRLGYEVLEPDSNTDVRHCCLSMPRKVKCETVQGMSSLLKASRELPHEVVKHASQVSQEDHHLLKTVVTTLKVSPKNIEAGSIKRLWNSHKSLAKLIGFVKDGHKDYRWDNTDTNNRNIWLVNVLLNGFHGNVEVTQYITLV